MDSQIREVLERAPETGPESSIKQGPVYGIPTRPEFYRARQRFYMALLIFVVAAGLPIVSIPVLRHRLSGRIQALREAMAGGTIKPVVMTVGENKEPFPAEYEKKAGPPNYPRLPAYFAATQGLAGPAASASVVPERAPARSKRTIRIPNVSAETRPSESAQAPAAGQDAGSAEAQPAYQQGLMEKTAYDLLLKSNATVNGMVQGGNPSLRFKSWDALKRDEDTYWVRLTFTSAADNSSVEYIWQVKILAKQVTPLSYNARSLTNP